MRLKRSVLNLSIGSYINKPNYLQLLDLQKRVKKLISDKEGYLKEFTELEKTFNYCKKVKEEIKALEADLLKINKAINKYNNYKRILIVTIKEEYTEEKIQIIFPRGTKKDFIKLWIYENYGLLEGYKTYNTYNEYDCSGAICASNLKLKASTAQITFYYDL